MYDLDLSPASLRTFLAVFRRRNYTRAAGDCFLSQPAVSRQVHALERRLGVRLFEQVGKAIHATDAGRTLAREAERLLGDLGRVAEAVRAHGEPSRGRLRVGASTTPGHYLVPAVLGRFHRRYPAVALHYRVEDSRSVLMGVAANELDLGFVGGPVDAPDLVVETLAEDAIVCYAAPSHPLAARRTVSVRALAEATWVLRARGSATRAAVETWLAKAGGTMGPVIELGCPEAVKAVAAAGVGLAFGSRRGLAAGIGQGRLRPLRVPGLPVWRPLAMVRHRDKHVTPVLAAAMAMARAAGGRRRPPGRPKPPRRSVDATRA